MRWLLSHRAGLMGPRRKLTTADVFDWDLVPSELAESEPWFEPGSVSAYHALTFGYLVGEVFRRITGTTVGTFLAKEVTGPLGADLFIGCPETEQHRCADMVGGGVDLGDGPIGASLPAAAHPALISLANLPAPADVNAPEWRGAEMPAGNGQMTGKRRAWRPFTARWANQGRAFGRDDDRRAGDDIRAGAGERHGGDTGPVDGRCSTRPSNSVGVWGSCPTSAAAVPTRTASGTVAPAGPTPWPIPRTTSGTRVCDEQDGRRHRRSRHTQRLARHGHVRVVGDVEYDRHRRCARLVPARPRRCIHRGQHCCRRRATSTSSCGARAVARAWCSSTAVARIPTGGPTSRARFSERVPGGRARSVGPRRFGPYATGSTPSSSGPRRSWPSAPTAGISGKPVVIGHSMGGFVRDRRPRARHGDSVWPVSSSATRR